MIDKLYLLWDDINGCDVIVLSEECCDRQTYITGAGNSDVVFFIKNRLIYDRFFLFE